MGALLEILGPMIRTFSGPQLRPPPQVNCSRFYRYFTSFFFFYLSFAPGTFLYCTPGQSCTRCERLEGRSKDVTDAEGDQFLLEMKRWRHYVTVSPRLPQVCVVSSTHLVSVYGVVVFH